MDTGVLVAMVQEPYVGSTGVMKQYPGPRDHMLNAFLEYIALIKATTQANLAKCKDILHTFHLGVEESLRVKLAEAEAAIYDNKTSNVVCGKMADNYMVAYCESAGFVPIMEKETEIRHKPVFATPPGDHIVVTARCTKVMLDDRILATAESIMETVFPN
ncbi:unnamed protein product, partial [Iphiclides podalirius]